MSIYGVHKLCRAALHDLDVRSRLKSDAASALRSFPLSADETRMLLKGDVAGLWEAGASGFLLSYLTRWELFGLSVELYAERMRKAKDWRYPRDGAPSSDREARRDKPSGDV